MPRKAAIRGDEQRIELTRLPSSRTLESGSVDRAKIVLMSLEELKTKILLNALVFDRIKTDGLYQS